MIYFYIISLIIALLIGQDALKRGMKSWVWALGVFLLPIIFLPWYLLTRKSKLKTTKQKELINAISQESPYIVEQKIDKMSEDINDKQIKDDDRFNEEENVKTTVRNEVNEIIDSIVKSITSEEPLLYFFINKNIIEKKASRGTVGLLLLGSVGQALAASPASIDGRLGILLVTKNQIIINEVFSEFNYNEIVNDQTLLNLLYSKLQTKKEVKQKVFNLKQTRVIASNETDSSKVSLVYNSEVIEYNISQLYINNNLIELPNINDLIILCNDLGNLISISKFIEKLLKKENPMNEIQYKEVENNDNYFQNIFFQILKHKNRDIIIANLSFIIMPIRNIIENKIKKKAKKFTMVLIGNILSFIIAAFTLFAGIYIYNHYEDVYSKGEIIFSVNKTLGYLSFIGVVSFICFLFLSVSIRDIIWCRKVVRNYL